MTLWRKWKAKWDSKRRIKQICLDAIISPFATEILSEYYAEHLVMSRMKSLISYLFWSGMD